MAGHRAQWKGFIKFGEVSCGVGLYTAASTSERISFHTINKRTGNRVNRVSSDAFTALRDTMDKSKVAAVARTVLFRRMRTVLIGTHGKGLIVTTLQFDYEVRSSEKAFDDIPKLRIKGEMLDLAKHIIATQKKEPSIPPRSTIATRRRSPNW